ncbi:histidine kinase [Flavobacterium lindanitolerans]|nr:histidine kinase [Flavobacterium lindanitolerans]
MKNQINPHFLFNMLNNVNVLVKKIRKRLQPLL